MKTLTLIFFSLTLVCKSTSAQLNETFTDGNYTTNPVWTATGNDWIVNAAQQLQSNSTTASSTFYITTENHLATNTQWEFYVRLNFNTSSANYTDVYLTASTSNLAATNTTGYFVRIGNSDDEISLYRKDANGNAVKIIDGVNSVTNTSDNTFKIRVTRDAQNRFTLYRTENGKTNFITEGSVIDATYTTSSFFGILIKQSTSSFFKKHFFNDIVVQPFVPDTLPPAIQQLTPTSSTSLDVLFTEGVTTTSAENILNYFINNSDNAFSAKQDANNAALVHLTFSKPFFNGTNSIAIKNIRDNAGNLMADTTFSFPFYLPQRFDVVIDEIMADPTPVVGLPGAEYVELKNVSGRSVNLQGWKLQTATGVSGAFPAFILPADSFVILTSSSQTAALQPYGSVLTVPAFPSLDNEGTLLSIISKEGATIHAVDYKVDWYGNSIKQDGGWSLEMIDTHNPCSGLGNWRASIDAKGGTPGKTNSIDGNNIDTQPPHFKNAFMLNDSTLILEFDESLDSVIAATTTNYILSPGIDITSAIPVAPLFHRVALHLSNPLLQATIYTVTANIADCSGNLIHLNNKRKVALPQEAQKNDIVINEILFNAKPFESDYVELYNRSNKVIDAGQLYLANRAGSGAIASIKKLFENPFYLFPGEYLVITEDKAKLASNYFVKDPDAVVQISSLPTYPDDDGNVVLVNLQGHIIDEVAYNKNWHFALLKSDEGVALERIDPDAPSNDKNNWHSAASTAGYGTPGYKNSQYHQTEINNTTITITPKIFSPDNDGQDDVATIQYSVDASGYVANIFIFDAAGRQVRHLVKNALLALNGYFIWDGLGEQANKLPVGAYIIYTEVFTVQGKKQHFKQTIVLARKLN